MPRLGSGMGMSRSQLAQRSYDASNSIVDLGVVGATTLRDLSGTSNTGTLFSGRHISTDGINDKGINADCSAEGSGTYYLTGYVRPATVTTAKQTLDGGTTASNLTGLTADVWQTFQTADFTGTPSNVILGWDGTVFGAADYSDVRLYDASDDSVVAYWPLADSADVAASGLDGFPAFDSKGSGYHGAHVGCSGGTAEDIIIQTIGLDWNRYMYFNGVDSQVVVPSQDLANNSFSIKFLFTTGEQQFFDIQDDANSGSIITGTLNNTVTANKDLAIKCSSLNIVRQVYTIASGSLEVNKVYFLSITTDSSGFVNSCALNDLYGNSITVEDQGTANYGRGETATNPSDDFVKLGLRDAGGLPYRGILYEATLGALNYAGDGADSTNWNGATINGSSINILLSQSLSDEALDSFGEGIRLARPNSKVLNIFGDGEKSTITASASLDTTKTVSEWLYYDGTDAVLIDLGTPTISSSSGSLTSSGFTVPTYHVNGVATATLGAVGWKHIMVTSTAALDCDNIDILKTSAHLVLYSDVKTTATALQNYNAEKSQFGLS